MKNNDPFVVKHHQKILLNLIALMRLSLTMINWSRLEFLTGPKTFEGDITSPLPLPTDAIGTDKTKRSPVTRINRKYDF